MEIKVKRNLCSVIISIVVDLFVAIFSLELLFSGGNPEAFILVLAFGGIALYITELGFMHFTLDELGLHQHFLFHTHHASWNSFSYISIEQAENAPKGIKVVCFNSEVLDLGNQHVNIGLHPLRYHTIYLYAEVDELRKKQRKLGLTGCMHKEDFLRMMDRCSVLVHSNL